MKHTTEHIIEALRADGEPKLLLLAADRLEELQLELTETRAELNSDYKNLQRALKNVERITKERDEIFEKGNIQYETICEITKQRNDAIAQAEKAYKLRKEAEIERDSLRDTMALDILELTKQRDEARAEVERLNRELGKTIDFGVIKERDEARSEVARLLKTLEEWTQVHTAEVERFKAENQRLKNLVGEMIEEEAEGRSVSLTRPEPSRLEIAAMMMAANLSRETEQWDTYVESTWAVEQADALIAAAKEGK